MKKNRFFLAILFICSNAWSCIGVDVYLDSSAKGGFGRFNGFGSFLKKGEFLLTFDDGPSKYTNKVADLLKSRCAGGVFFVIGKKVASEKNTIKRLFLDGFLVGSHGFEHINLNTVSLSSAIEDVELGFGALGLPEPQPKLFRPPYFVLDKDLMRYLFDRDVIIFSADLSVRDWAYSSHDIPLENFSKWVESNDRGIVVFHDNKPSVLDLVSGVVDILDSKGYSAIRLHLKNDF